MSFNIKENSSLISNPNVAYGKATENQNTPPKGPYAKPWENLSSSQKNRVLLVKKQQQKILGLNIQSLTEKLNKEREKLQEACAIIPIFDYTTGLPIEEHTSSTSNLLNPQSASPNKNEGGLRKKIGKLNATLAEQNKKIATLTKNVKLLQDKLTFLKERANSILVTLQFLNFKDRTE